MLWSHIKLNINIPSADLASESSRAVVVVVDTSNVDTSKRWHR